MSDMSRSQTMLAGLQKRYAYPGLTIQSINVCETHCSWVLLTGEFAFKVKKPVDLGFLDFSSLEKRLHYCQQEIKLNKRFAPDIYMSVVPIRGTHKSPVISTWDDNDLPVIDYAVKLHQFPKNQLLSDLARESRLKESHIDQVIDLLAVLHRDASTINEATANTHKVNTKCDYGCASLIKRRSLENFEQIATYVRGRKEKEILAELLSWTKNKNTKLDSFFKCRKIGGHIRDCHGDLHLGNMTIINEHVRIFDCIEFNDDFRWIDVISEVAFLMMDLLVHGYHELSNRLINGYLQKTGDYHGLQVLNYYHVYRSMVRAKVAILRRSQMKNNTSAKSESVLCLRYLRLAEIYTRRAPPIFVITYGLSGSGKSVVSFHLSQTIGLIQIRSDIERKRQAHLNVCEPSFHENNSHESNSHESNSHEINFGIYSQNSHNKTYSTMLLHAKHVIDAGYSVILDATFLSKDKRSCAAQLAERMNVPFAILKCNAPEYILEHRILHRLEENQDFSDATVSVLHYQQATREPLSEKELCLTIDVDTSKNGYLKELQNDLFFKVLKMHKLKTEKKSKEKPERVKI